MRSFALVSLVLVILIEVKWTVLISEAKSIHIPDELDDVVDDEEDEAWKEWGRPKPKDLPPFDPPPDDLMEMEASRIQAEMLKRHFGPSIGFVKLRLGVSRTKEEVTKIAKKWTELLKSGSIDAKFTAVDLSTVMFTMERGQDTTELKDFVLSQPEAYEFKLGQHAFRRPGDPPLEEVVEQLHRNDPKKNADDTHWQSNNDKNEL